MKKVISIVSILLINCLIAFSQNYSSYKIAELSLITAEGKQPWTGVRDEIRWDSQNKSIFWCSQNVSYQVKSVINSSSNHISLEVIPSSGAIDGATYQIDIDEDQYSQVLYIFIVKGGTPIAVIGLSMIDKGLLRDVHSTMEP